MADVKLGLGRHQAGAAVMALAVLCISAAPGFVHLAPAAAAPVTADGTSTPSALSTAEAQAQALEQQI
ncbi:MAG: hypothetical protein ACREOE_11090, partial [Gemmatimonadales bacterium]